MTRHILILLVIALLVACGQKKQNETAQAPQPVDISLDDAGARKAKPAAVLPVVKSFSVSPLAAKPGQPVTASVEVANAVPEHSVTLAWFGPDGWLVSDEQQMLSSATLKFQPQTLTEPGVYHAALRDTQTATPLASTSVTVGG